MNHFLLFLIKSRWTDRQKAIHRAICTSGLKKWESGYWWGLKWVIFYPSCFALALDRFLRWCSLQITERFKFYWHATLGGQERQNILDYFSLRQCQTENAVTFFLVTHWLCSTHTHSPMKIKRQHVLRGPPGLDIAFLWRDQNPW